MPRKKKLARVLLIEDDAALSESVEMFLSSEGYEVTTCADGKEGMSRAVEGGFDLVITDFRLPSAGGMEIVTAVKEACPGLPVIMMTSHGTTDTVIESTRRGAFDFIVKPFDLDVLISLVEKAADSSRLSKPVVMDVAASSSDALIGESDVMRNVYKEVGRLASTRADVLITGDVGTGKELVARSLYQHSDRSMSPFFSVSCSATGEQALDTALFGHKAGAFAGAETDRVGRIEQADGATIFIDDIAEMPLSIQGKLLRVLEDRVIRPLGSEESLAVDARIIAATHESLDALVEDKRFREDLFYRLRMAVIDVPGLDERKDDIPLLARHFSVLAAEQFEFSSYEPSKAVLTHLQKQEWPGNVRQLENLVYRIALDSQARAIHPANVDEALEALTLKPTIADGSGESLDRRAQVLVDAAREAGAGDAHAMLVEEAERALFSYALRVSGGHQSKAAEWLGLSRVTLRHKMAKYGITP